MQIAIVDDRAEDREELSACLENYMKKHQLDYTLTEFEDGENFSESCRPGQFFSLSLWTSIWRTWMEWRPPEGCARKTGFVRSFF